LILSFDCSFCLIAWYLYFLLPSVNGRWQPIWRGSDERSNWYNDVKQKITFT